MKVNLTDEDLAERKSGNYFDVGVYEVYIKSATRDTTTGGKEFVKFDVLGPDDQEGDARLWFTTDASSKYALSILAGIAVHNREGEAAKDKVRQAFKGISDTDEVNDKFLSMFKDMQAWVSVYEDTNGQQKPDGGYYKRTDIYGYEPKPKAPKQLSVDDIMPGGQKVDPDSVPFA